MLCYAEFVSISKQKTQKAPSAVRVDTGPPGAFESHPGVTATCGSRQPQRVGILMEMRITATVGLPALGHWNEA